MFQKFFAKKIKLSQSKTALLFAFFITFFYNFNFLTIKFNDFFNQQNLGFTNLIIEISLSFFLIFLILYLSSFHKKIFYFTVFIILLFSGVTAYAINKFGITIDQTVIANLLDNIGDFGDVLIFKDVFLYSLFFIILPTIILAKIEITRGNDKKNFILISVLLLIFTIILSSVNHRIRKGIIFAYPPFNIIKCCTEYYQDLYSSKKQSTSLLPINDIVKATISHKATALKIVLVIGESARADHFAINGYAKNTTPKIEKIAHFLSFKDVTPCNNVTRYSVACMLSRIESKNFSFPLQEESIIKIFEKLNFSTSWFSTQKAIGDNNTLMMLALEAQNYYFADHIAAKIGGNMIYDEYLLTDLKKEMMQPRDSFIILHTQGSHFLFSERYPENFKKFTPQCENKDLKRCNKEEIINAYDNTIYYTDYFLDSIINELKNSNALFIYISDHGQFLGENNVYYHGKSGSHTDQQHRVPMFFWMSDKLLRDKFYKNKFQKASLKTAKKLSHDDLFGSLLDCAGVNYEGAKSSVCR